MGVARRRRAVHCSLALFPSLVLLLGGCATLPLAAPIPDIPAIARQWRGNIHLGRGPYEILYVTISPDGGLWVAVADGRARFELYIWSGDLQYLVGPGQRIIVMKDDFLTFYAQATPLT